MNNEYTASEVIEIGKAQESILGEKIVDLPPDTQGFRPVADNDLDD